MAKKLLLTMAGCFVSIAIYADPAAPIASDNIHQSVTSNGIAQTTEKSTDTIAKLTLAQEDKRLYARVIIEQPQTNPGKIIVEWTPPAHSNCMKSDYELSYEGKKFHTQSYRTIAFSNKDKTTVCHGSWQVAVKDLNGIQLAQSEFNVTAKGAV